MSEELISRATEYLTNGGLFNPELMDHEKVRDLIYQMRNEIASAANQLLKDQAQGERQWIKCSDELPEIGESVLIKKTRGQRLVCEAWRQIRFECDPEFSWRSAFGVVLPEHVSHWMQLPGHPND